MYSMPIYRANHKEGMRKDRELFKGCNRMFLTDDHMSPVNAKYSKCAWLTGSLPRQHASAVDHACQ